MDGGDRMLDKINVQKLTSTCVFKKYPPKLPESYKPTLVGLS